MKSNVLRALPLIAFVITLSGCDTYNRPSAIEKAFYKECAPEPPQVPCGRH